MLIKFKSLSSEFLSFFAYHDLMENRVQDNYRADRLTFHSGHTFRTHLGLIFYRRLYALEGNGAENCIVLYEHALGMNTLWC